jgi:gamma-glutamylcyclotransferase (GGCT)/AIG2-like uncharacterized protein YtfP
VSGHLFLYGTLLPGLARPPLDALVARLRPLGPATIPGRLYDLGPYPGLVPDPSAASRVCGELFALPDDPALLAALDDYEGDPRDDGADGLFRRVEVLATLADGRAVPCWVYAYNGGVGRAVPISYGDYREWRRRVHGAAPHGPPGTDRHGSE